MIEVLLLPVPQAEIQDSEGPQKQTHFQIRSCTTRVISKVLIKYDFIFKTNEVTKCDKIIEKHKRSCVGVSEYLPLPTSERQQMCLVMVHLQMRTEQLLNISN